MSSSGVAYQVLILPPLFILGLLKTVVVPPVLLLVSIILLPFRILYAFFGSLWWILPLGSRRASTDPPTFVDFLLASLFIGLIAGLVLYITSRILFALPELFGTTLAANSEAGQKPIPSPREVQKRIKEQAKKVQLLQELRPEPIRVSSTGPSRLATSDSKQHRLDQIRTQEHRSKDNVQWEDRWQQQHQDLSPRSLISPVSAISPTANRDSIGVARQTIVEESSDDEDIEYFD